MTPEFVIPALPGYSLADDSTPIVGWAIDTPGTVQPVSIFKIEPNRPVLCPDGKVRQPGKIWDSIQQHAFETMTAGGNPQ